MRMFVMPAQAGIHPWASHQLIPSLSDQSCPSCPSMFMPPPRASVVTTAPLSQRHVLLMTGHWPLRIEAHAVTSLGVIVEIVGDAAGIGEAAPVRLDLRQLDQQRRLAIA